MIAGSSEQIDAGGGVGFVGLKVEEDANGANADEAGEMNIQMMRLRTVGSAHVSLHAASRFG